MRQLEAALYSFSSCESGRKASVFTTSPFVVGGTMRSLRFAISVILCITLTGPVFSQAAKLQTKAGFGADSLGKHKVDVFGVSGTAEVDTGFSPELVLGTKG